jgi:hypothetical protein
VWGDSHALALLPAYREVGRERALEIYFAISPACRPLLEVTAPKHNEHQRDRCVKFNAAMLQAVRALQPDVVVLNAYWTYPDMNLVPDASLEMAAGDSVFMRGIEETLRRIESPGRAVCTVLDVPVYEHSVPFALAIARHRGIEDRLERFTRAGALEQQAPVERDLRALASRGRTRIVDPKDVLCGSGTCQTTSRDGASLYRDGHHLSAVGALFVAETLQGCFE